MSDREVVVTGMGLVTPLGLGVEENWTHLRDLKTGISQQRQDDLPGCFRYAGTVAPLALPSVPAGLVAQLKFLNRGALLGLTAACEAMAQGRAGARLVAPASRALFIASGDFSKIGYEFLYPATEEEAASGRRPPNYERINQRAVTGVYPFFLLESISNNLFSLLSACYDFHGPNTSLASLSPYGSQALELAYRSIQSGAANAALAVGYGHWTGAIPVYELEGLGLLSRCEDGPRSFKPFDRSRDGFIPGEGGAAIFLETSELAEKRGGAVLARIRGCGNCIELSEPRGLSVPSKVTERSMRAALEEARCSGKDLAFLLGHGSGTQKGDRSELRSVLEMMEADSVRVPVCGLKAYTGHMGAASDIAEVILGIKSAGSGMAPATLHFGRAEKEFAHVAISETHQPASGNCFLSVSYGLGGQSSAVIVAANRA
jgi:3-oxoacyl-[acyl-carrier-protein] synthase II